MISTIRSMYNNFGTPQFKNMWDINFFAPADDNLTMGVKETTIPSVLVKSITMPTGFPEFDTTELSLGVQVYKERKFNNNIELTVIEKDDFSIFNYFKAWLREIYDTDKQVFTSKAETVFKIMQLTMKKIDTEISSAWKVMAKEAANSAVSSVGNLATIGLGALDSLTSNKIGSLSSIFSSNKTIAKNVKSGLGSKFGSIANAAYGNNLITRAAQTAVKSNAVSKIINSVAEDLDSVLTPDKATQTFTFYDVKLKGLSPAVTLSRDDMGMLEWTVKLCCSKIKSE